MVRINLIDPNRLADQHLIAEYNEILMLLGHVDKHPEIRNQPLNYKLGKGHITFFKDKLSYLKKRHQIIKKEMKNREFKTTKTLDLKKYPRELKKDWKPSPKDFSMIKDRLVEKIKMKKGYYRYYGKTRSEKFLLSLLNKK